MNLCSAAPSVQIEIVPISTAVRFVLKGILSKFDVIAIQEVRDVEVLETLRDQFMVGYDFVVSDLILYGVNKNLPEVIRVIPIVLLCLNGSVLEVVFSLLPLWALLSFVILVEIDQTSSSLQSHPSLDMHGTRHQPPLVSATAINYMQQPSISVINHVINTSTAQ